jgi:hypothetical protein
MMDKLTRDDWVLPGTHSQSMKSFESYRRFTDMLSTREPLLPSKSHFRRFRLGKFFRDVEIW